MNKFFILANNGSHYYRDLRWPKYNVAYLSWFLSFTEYNVISVLDCSKNNIVEKIDDFISGLSPDDTAYVYMSGIGGNRNGINGFLPYEYSNIDEGLIDIADVLGKFKGKPVILFIDVYSPRTSFRKFDFSNYSFKNCYIAYNCSDIQGPCADGTVFTGRLIRAMFGHSGTTLSKALDSFQVAMNQSRKTKSTNACAYDSLQPNKKQVFLQGVSNNQEYQTQKKEPEDFPWIYNMWQKLKGEKEFEFF